MFGAYMIGNLHARHISAEGDEEMVIARQAVLGRVGQDGFDNGTQSILHKQVIADQVVGIFIMCHGQAL